MLETNNEYKMNQYRIVLKVLKFSNMFRSIFDHPQGDIFSFTSVTKDKIIWFVVACL